MRKKIQGDFIITDKIHLNATYFKLVLHSEVLIPSILPGQFVNVLVPNSPGTFLRRPISISDVDGSSITLLIRIAGKGTEMLSKMCIGNKLNLLLPLGNSFTIPSVPSSVLLIGGGVGVAPMLFLGKQLKEHGHKPFFLIGARSQSDLLYESEFSEIGKLFISTEDGSKGEKGLITLNSAFQQLFHTYYVCGPDPMMKAIARIATMKNVNCEVSLENMMACGIGACLCCVEDTLKGNTCVCTEGPVFNINELKWQI